MTTQDVVYILTGIALLGLAGDNLVKFASALAEKARISPAVIGLTVVAAGTSFPELMVSVSAALGGSPDIAVGNVVGSNICNLTFILGSCAVVAAIPMPRAVLSFEYPVMLLGSGVVLLLARDGMLDRVECAFLLAAMLAFVGYSVWVARRQLTPAEQIVAGDNIPDEATQLSLRPVWLLVGALLLCFGGLSLGAELLVDGASNIAKALGVSQRVVGLTVVAVGTSLPELVASLMAALRKQHEMAVTNVVGSNIFNILMILGITGLVKPIPIAAPLANFDMPVMVGVAVLVWVLAWFRRNLSRLEGLLLLGSFGAYTAYLVVLG